MCLCRPATNRGAIVSRAGYARLTALLDERK